MDQNLKIFDFVRKAIYKHKYIIFGPNEEHAINIYPCIIGKYDYIVKLSTRFIRCVNYSVKRSQEYHLLGHDAV
jgi:hypothetical protein